MDTNRLLPTFHGDFRGHGATLKACTVPIFS